MQSLWASELGVEPALLSATPSLWEMALPLTSPITWSSDQEE